MSLAPLAPFYFLLSTFGEPFASFVVRQSVKFLPLLLALFLNANVTADGRTRSVPVSACIVNSRGELQKDDLGRAGNVRVTFADGHREMWTHRGRAMMAKVSKSGLVGWTRATGRNLAPGHLWMNGDLVLARDGQVIAKLEADDAFIEVWAFTDNDTCVVVRSRMLHGPSTIEKFKIATKERIGQCSGSDPSQLEDWARPYWDEADF